VLWLRVRGLPRQVEAQVASLLRALERDGAWREAIVHEGHAAGEARECFEEPFFAALDAGDRNAAVVVLRVLAGRLGAVLQHARRACDAAGVSVDVHAHPWKGVTWLALGLDTDLPSAGAAAALVDELRSVARAAHGTLVVHSTTPEIGCSIDAWGEPPSSIALMRRLKTLYDPAGVLNAGRHVGAI
jgi:FAD/FMN-containing dehydrogenase